jgi:glycosyltransferase involved in cell wall biosynthesis
MEEIYDYCVFITTYNRPYMLSNLIQQIQNQKNYSNIKIVVFDDDSDEKYHLPDEVSYFKFFPNMGKKKFWKVINTCFKLMKQINSKYYVFLQDDVKIKENFFYDLQKKYEEIDDPKKISLSFLSDNRVKSPNWTNYKPRVRGEVIKTQWIELHFICEKKLFEALEYKMEPINPTRWDVNPLLSSGVGWQMSLRLHNKGYGMYHTKESFVSHGDHESKMNKQERFKNKLVV